MTCLRVHRGGRALRPTPHEWFAYGVEQGWISDAVCATHDGLPSTDDENDEWEAGWDPCVPAVRLWI
jgi:hypothetical protein